MFVEKSWSHASAHAGRRACTGRNLLPIRRLGPAQREAIVVHLRALDPRDRLMRFGWCASDAQLEAYVAGLDFVRDQVFGIFDRRLELIALAQLAPVPGLAACEGSLRAEFGISVTARVRGRGHAGRLFARAVLLARGAGIGEILVQALVANAAMLRVARRAGATVQRSGPEWEARLSTGI